MKDYKLEIKQQDDYLYAYYEAERDTIALSNDIWVSISKKMKEFGIPVDKIERYFHRKFGKIQQTGLL